MKQSELSQLFVSEEGDLKLQMSTMSFYIQGNKEDMFGNSGFLLTYFKN